MAKITVYPTKIEGIDDEDDLIFSLSAFDADTATLTIKSVISLGYAE